MRGSLDQPPVIVVASRWKFVLYLLIAIGFTAIGLWQVLTETPLWWAYLSIAFFGFGCIVFAAQLVRPAQLVIAPEGVTWSILWRTDRFAWWQIGPFWPQAVTTFSRHVWFDLRKTRDGATRAGSFGTGWEMPVAELCDLLNAARERWCARDGSLLYAHSEQAIPSGRSGRA
jgi:hypothetical protein